MFVSMPSYKTRQTDEYGKPVYQAVCYPVTKELREKLYEEIIQTYEKEREKQKAVAKENEVNPEKKSPVRRQKSR